MTKLVRFHDWIIDQNEISYIKITDKDGNDLNPDCCEYDRKDHIVLLTLKNDGTFKCHCESLYSARETLDYFTLQLDEVKTQKNFDNYILKQVYFVRECMRDLEIEVKKLMNSFKKEKNKKVK